MPVSDKIQQLEERIRQRIEQSLGEIKQELLVSFRTQTENLREQLNQFSASLPDDLFLASDLEPVLQEVSQEARQAQAAESTGAPPSSSTDLREALAALDTARSQGDLLRALLAQCGRFASRAAVFLAQPGKLKGWGGHNLGDAEETLKESVIEVTEGSAWERLVSGEGVVHLGSSERATLASRLEIPVAQDAVLLPLLLRDRVAGAVYADRTGESDGGLAVESLQTLTYVAALAIETLPLRKRESTPTLKPDSAAQPAAEAPTPPATDLPPSEAPRRESLAAGFAPPTETPAPPEPPAQEAASPEPAAPEPEPEPSGSVLSDVDDMDLGDVSLEADEEISLDTPAEAPSIEAPSTEAPSTDAAPSEASVTAAPSYDAPSYDGPSSEAPSEGTPPSEGLTTGPETAQVGEMLEEQPSQPPTWTLEEEPSEDAGAAGAGGAAGASVADATSQGATPQEAAPPPAAPPAESQEPSAPSAPDPSAPQEVPPPGPGAEDTHPGGEGAQVAPPSDVQGPGWAFAGTEEKMDGDEEARHEEAKRLARLLVSEIKLYNEEHVHEGRQNNDIFERLKDDIERSRQLYDARVDERVREKTDYFYQEMVRVLGAGDPKTLGI